MDWLLQHHCILQRPDGGFNLEPWFGFAVYLILSIAARLTNLTLGNKIEQISDGEGSDPGSSYIYVPDLLPEESINWGDESYNRQNTRVKILTWVILPLYGAFSIVFCVMIVLLPRVYWLFSERNPANQKRSF